MNLTGRLARVGLVAALLGAAAARPASAVDLSGVYASVHAIFGTSCTLTFVQTGSALTISGPCLFGTPNYTFELAGTVDEASGSFSTSGVLHGLCETPGSVTMVGSGDGSVFTALTACGSVSAGVTGSKCNNGMLDAVEDCEDGNTAAGDCCSPTCQFEPSGSACAADSNACTLDQCDGAGACAHQDDPAAAGEPCASDLNPCTDDVCNAAGQCTHPFNSTPCSDANPCTDPDTCAAGTCVGGPLVPACAGSIDVTGDWIVTAENTLFTASAQRRFVQSGAVVETNDLESGMTGVGAINPATGALQAQTPFIVIYWPCLEVITATVTADGRAFSGTSTAYCGIEGTWGPYAISGRRCDPAIGCACDIAECVAADPSTRVAAAAQGDGVGLQWRWDHLPMADGIFQDPTAATDYRLCLLSADGRVAEDIAHGAGWRATDSGFRYTSVDGPVRRLLLRNTARQMSVIVRARPSTAPALPWTTPVSLRLIRLGTQPLCLEATFDQPLVNSRRRFRAKK